jgi:hypothetical protein
MRERKLCTHMKSSVMLLSIWHDICIVYLRNR